MLIKCPECELQVSDKEKLFPCPHCGYPMQTSTKSKKASETKKQQATPFTKRVRTDQRN